MKKNCLVAFLLVPLFLLCARAEMTNLTSASGQSIEAEILSVNGEDLRIRRADGQTFYFKMNMLDEASQQKVREWAKSNIPKDAFDISVRERKVNESEKSVGMVLAEIEEMQFTFKIEYSHTVVLENLRLDYHILYREARVNQPNAEDGEKKRFSGSIDIPKLEPRKELELKSLKNLEIWETEFDSDNNEDIEPPDPDKAEDEIEGWWVRLYDGDKLLYEMSSPKRTMEKEQWNPKSAAEAEEDIF